MSRDDPADGGVVSRWSRLKRARRQGIAEPESSAAEPASGALREAAPHPGASPAKADGEILEELGLPDPDSLAPGDDIRGFMAEQVPARLRNRALRKLWSGNPVLANLDELVDYGEDFTDAARVVEGLASAWQAGRGYPKPAPPPLEGTAQGETDPTEPTPADVPDGRPARDDQAFTETEAEAPAPDDTVAGVPHGAAPEDVAAPDPAGERPARPARPPAGPPTRAPRRRMVFSLPDGATRG